MSKQPREPTEGNEKPRLEGRILVLALLLPSVGAWLYFVRLADHAWAMNAYFGAKICQFSLPLVALLPSWRTGSRPRTTSRAAWRWGLGSGVLLSFLSAPLYLGIVRGSNLGHEVARRIGPKLVDFSVEDLRSYVVLALLLSFVHSFLEEYYFRWFLFGRLRHRIGLTWALWISAFGFMAHHIIVLATYLGREYWPITILLSAGIAIGGVFWAWLYHRTGRLLAPWLSHVLVDLAIMAIGYDLIGF